MVSAVVSCPFDILKTRFQLFPEKMVKLGITKTLIKINREEGFKAFFAGVKARALTSVFVIPVFINCYEISHKFYY